MEPSESPPLLLFAWSKSADLVACSLSAFDKANEIYFRLGIIYKQQHKYSSSLDVSLLPPLSTRSVVRVQKLTSTLSPCCSASNSSSRTLLAL